MRRRTLVGRRALDGRRTRDLLDVLAPSVESVRRQLFGKPRPPFQSPEEATRWIEEEAEREDLPPVDSERLTALRQQLKCLTEEWGQLTASRLHLRQENAELRYLKPNHRQPVTMRVAAGSRLDQLAQACHKMAEATGYAEEHVVALILHGEERPHPVMQVRREAVSVTLPDGSEQGRFEAVVRIFDPRIPSAKWRQVKETVARLWGELFPSGLDAVDEAIVKIVQELGGPPEDHPWSLKFWDRVAKQLRVQGVRHSRDAFYKDGHGPLGRVRQRPALKKAIGIADE